MLVAAALAADAFAVSLANGVIIKDVKLRHALKFGIYFGSFQCGMTLMGWLAGHSVAGFVSAYAPWVAFILLTFIGCNMIIEGAKRKNEVKFCGSEQILGWKNMTMLAVATSIDALAVGVGLAVIKISIISAAAAIGAFAFSLSFMGTLLGNKLNKLFKKYAETAGGIILIIIGLKILINSFA